MLTSSRKIDIFKPRVDVGIDPYYTVTSKTLHWPVDRGNPDAPFAIRRRNGLRRVTFFGGKESIAVQLRNSSMTVSNTALAVCRGAKALRLLTTMKSIQNGLQPHRR